MIGALKKDLRGFAPNTPLGALSPDPFPKINRCLILQEKPVDLGKVKAF